MAHAQGSRLSLQATCHYSNVCHGRTWGVLPFPDAYAQATGFIPPSDQAPKRGFSFPPFLSSGMTMNMMMMKRTPPLLLHRNGWAGGVEPHCAPSSLSTSFALSFISYGNYTALPGQGDDTGLVPAQLVSMSFAVANEANGVYTVCAFPLGHLSSGGGGGRWIEDASWQPCADRKDTDGKHRFTIATGAAFAMSTRSIAVNQTWFCHDEGGRLVAYTGISNATLDMACGDDGELGGYHVENCTASDIRLPVTLL
ncbi:uncharacterized protein GGS25DRAFT_529417 [Hypoxylon fragiforme]|uniref:uncharacterized protein n=1 Tax=Hypoxylon fragiforme TaxID=63214 RepID=UPI0020C61F0C|nr:uncharacterized protein GGS25DRAFT_529417 [Hypoxylon fragiforme]KAI2612881.1 hypothetical protein GGS25DRAFT_529417 [Hypoxylon fragiforme]